MPRRRLSGSQQLLAECLEPRTMLSASTSTAPDAATPGEGIGAFASDAAYTDWIVEAAVNRWQSLFGQPAYGIMPVAMPGSVFFDSVAEVARDLSLDARDASTTNTQVAGVDEADLVETDGELVYALGAGRLSIVAGIADTPELVGQFDLPSAGQPVGMFLAGSRLTILTAAAGDVVPDAWAPVQSAFWRRFSTSPHTTVTVLNVADPAAVDVVSRTRVDGQLVASRMVEGQLRLVMNHSFTAPMPEVLPLAAQAAARPTVADAALPNTPFRAAPLVSPPWRVVPEGVYESQAAYVERVAAELTATMQPKLYRLDASGVVTAMEDLVAATAIDIPEHELVEQLTTVAVLDVGVDGPPPVASVGLLTVGQTEVYADAESVFVFDGHAGLVSPPGVPVIADWSSIAVWQPPVTDVARIDVGGSAAGGTTLGVAALGTFEGTLLNRFAVGTQAGALRAVVQQRGDGHGVVVLETQGEALEVVGSIGGIAADEQLYSARIAGDRAYFVTFRFTDPLFVVDLSVPTAPELLGELHVPGYADHLQPLEGGLLLAIGRDANERTGMFLGLQLSLFDVSAPENPTLLHRYTFAGGRETSTPITGNRWTRGDGDPLALGFFPEQGVVTIPVTTEGSPWWWERPIEVMPIDGGVVASAMAIDGLRVPPPPKQLLEVIRFDAEAGIVPLGTIDHTASVERSLRVGNRLVAVSASEVSVHDFSDPSTPLASLLLDDRPHVPVGEPGVPAAGPLTGFLEQGFPLFGAWAVQAIETVGSEEVAYATHTSGAVHRLTRQVGAEAWAGFAFERIGNLENAWLAPEWRGRAAPLASVSDAPAVATLVSDAVLEKLGLSRDDAGRLVRGER